MSQPTPECLAAIEMYHNQSMDCAEHAALAKVHGDISRNHDMTRTAFLLEFEAVKLLLPYHDYQPTYSILLTSLAALAEDWARVSR